MKTTDMKNVASYYMDASRVKVSGPRELGQYGTGALYGEQQFNFDKGWREGVAAMRKAIRDAAKNMEDSTNE